MMDDARIADFFTSVGKVSIRPPISQDVPEAVRALSGGAGADVVLDCAGAPVAFQGAIDALRLHGRMVVIAGYEKTVSFNPPTLGGSKSVSNSLTYTPEDFQDVIEGMAAGNYTIDGGWTEKVTQDQVEESTHRLRQGEGEGEGEGMKILVDVASH